MEMIVKKQKPQGLTSVGIRDAAHQAGRAGAEQSLGPLSAGAESRLCGERQQSSAAPLRPA